MATQSTTNAQPAQTAGGLVAAQGQAQTRATQARGSSKGWAYKLIKPVAFILIIVVPVLFWWRGPQDETSATQTTPASAEKGTGSDGGGTAGDAAKKGGDASTKDTRPKKTDTAARWSDQKAGEEIPVGKWSEETYVAPGCSLWFSIGDGDKVQHRYLNNTWLDYEPGSSPNATHIRHWVTKGGTTSRPYQLTCK